MTNQEQVLCLKNEMLEPYIQSGKNYYPLKEEEIKAFLQNKAFCFVSRSEAESNEDYKQIIPYCVVKKEDQLLAYQRKGNEKRLHGLFSCGIGGHINPCDQIDEGDLWQTILNATVRELHEELVMDCPYRNEFKGIIFEDITQVGRVHIGFVFEIVPDSLEKIASSEELGIIHLMNFEEIQNEEFELWSTLALKLLIPD
ncbi:MAG TPA: phosphoesterase [Candidatus Cloacimonadota bacterium]|nr:phosphoesterase [Candidatus Cloacimonadota bacterium]